MLSAFYMTKNIQIIIYYLIYMVKIQNGRQWTKMATKKMLTTFFLNNMTYFIKKMTLARIYPKFSHIDTTAYTNMSSGLDIRFYIFFLFWIIDSDSGSEFRKIFHRKLWSYQLVIGIKRFYVNIVYVYCDAASCLTQEWSHDHWITNVWFCMCVLTMLHYFCAQQTIRSNACHHQYHITAQSRKKNSPTKFPTYS